MEPIRAHSYRSIFDLPNELLFKIFNTFANCDAPRPCIACVNRDKTRCSYAALLRLRLVCKTLATLIVPTKFRSIRIGRNPTAQEIFQTWPRIARHAPDYSETPCPVKRLAFQSIYHKRTLQTYDILSDAFKRKRGRPPNYLIGPSKVARRDNRTPRVSPSRLRFVDSESDDCPPRIDVSRDGRDPSHEVQLQRDETSSMDQVVQVIELLGEDLNELELTFVNSFVFPEALVNAVARIKHLTSLRIIYKQSTELPWGLFRTKTIIDLLKMTPHLEFLGIDHLVLPDFTSVGINLPKVYHLHLAGIQEGSSIGVNSLCELVKDSVTILHMDGNPSSWTEYMPVFEAFRPNLEALFTGTRQVLHQMKLLEFPRLRLLGMTRMFPRSLWPPAGSPWPMLQNIRTVVTDAPGAEWGWRQELIDWHHYNNCPCAEGGLCAGPNARPLDLFPKIKHVIMCCAHTHHCDVKSASDALRKVGIEAHFFYCKNVKAVMELDEFVHKEGRVPFTPTCTTIVDLENHRAKMQEKYENDLKKISETLKSMTESVA